MSKPGFRSNSEGNKKPSRKSSLIAYLLQDTSITKASNERTKADRMTMAVTNKERLLKDQKNVRHITQKIREVQETWEKTVEDEINRYYYNKFICENSALKIQKIVRGFLVRLKIEPLLLEIREKNSKKITKDLRVQTDICMLSLGTNTIPAIKRIQSAYRRYVFRKKLVVMQRCYELYLKEREEILCDFLRKVLLNYSCKIKRDYLAFLEYRVIRMVQIKENLAILTVKNFWRSKKLSFKILKEKFIKIKRRKAAMQNKEAYQKYLASLGGSSPGPKKDHKKTDSVGKVQISGDGKNEDGNEAEKTSNPEDDEEFREAQRIKDIIDRKIREKVAMSKLAYAIPDKKDEKMLLPMMQEKALNEDLEDEGTKSKLFYLTLSNFAKGRSLSRESRPMTRNLHISTPKELNQRRHFDSVMPLPRFSLLESANTEFIQYPPLNIPEIEHAHFLLPTTVSAKRTEEPVQPRWKAVYNKTPTKKTKRMKLNLNVTSEGGERMTRPIQIKERTAKWIPVARRFFSYIPGLDNSGYSAPKWAPLPLNRRILQTANPVYSKRERKNSQSVIARDGNAEENAIFSQQHFLRKDQQHSVSPSTQDRSLDFTGF